MSRCPVPECSDAVPAKAVFCPDHYFMIPAKTAALITKLQIGCERVDEDKRKLDFQESLNGYIAQALRIIENQQTGPRCSSQAAPVSARRASSSLWAGASTRGADDAA